VVRSGGNSAVGYLGDRKTSLAVPVRALRPVPAETFGGVSDADCATLFKSYHQAQPLLPVHERAFVLDAVYGYAMCVVVLPQQYKK